jgi:septal ring factor EnvC (AmiA/AmiB activator)
MTKTAEETKARGRHKRLTATTKRIEETHEQVTRQREDLTKRLADVERLEQELADARRELSNTQCALSFYEGKLSREVAAVHGAVYGESSNSYGLCVSNAAACCERKNPY